MLLANRRVQYKYSSTGLQVRQENQSGKQNFTKGQSTFWAKALKIGLVIGVLGLIIIFYVNQYVQMSVLNDQIYHLKQELNTLVKENQKVDLEINKSKSLAHIEKEARGRLGLVEPNIHYIPAQKATEAADAQNHPAQSESKLALIAGEVGAWFKNLTSVEAGTLDE